MSVQFRCNLISILRMTPYPLIRRADVSYNYNDSKGKSKCLFMITILHEYLALIGKWLFIWTYLTFINVLFWTKRKPLQQIYHIQIYITIVSEYIKRSTLISNELYQEFNFLYYLSNVNYALTLINILIFAVDFCSYIFTI